MPKESFFKRNLPTFFFFLALAVAVALIIGAASFRLDDTRIRTSGARTYESGWTAEVDGQRRDFADRTRGGANAQGVPFAIWNTLPHTDARDVLAIETKNERVRAYRAGKLIYEYGWHDEACFGWEYGAVWNLIPLGDGEAGELIRVELTPIDGRTGEAPYRILLGDENAVALTLMGEKTVIILASLLMLIISIVCLLLSALFFAVKREQSLSLLHFGIFTLVTAVWTISDSLLFQFFFANKSVSYMLFNCSFLLMPIPFALFMSTRFWSRRKTYNAIACGLTAYFLARVALYLAGVANFEKALFLIHLGMALVIAATVRDMFRAWREGKGKARFDLSLGVMGMTVVDSASLIVFYVTRRLDVQRANYASGFYLGFLLFSVVMFAGVCASLFRQRRETIRMEISRRQAYADELTGMLSGKGFDEQATALLAAGKYAVIDMDINHFAQYNAAFGFAAGDALLLGVADGLRRLCRPGELCARLDADHFTCLIEAASLPDAVSRLTDGDRFFRENPLTRSVLFSYGVTQATPGVPVGRLRDQAMLAKRSVKGSYARNIGVYDEGIHLAQQFGVSIMGSFEQDLARGKYVVYAQPKVELATNRVAGAEALIRKVGDDGALVPPDSFIPILERGGLITKLDLFVFEQVLIMLRDARARGARPFPISVNFSRAHLIDGGLPDTLEKLVRKYDLPPQWIEVELTETAFFTDKLVLCELADKLHEKGFMLAIDDFGSGYSSLNMLKDMPVDVLKLDKGFFEHVSESPRTRTVVEAILRMADELHITTVAEGIETEAQLDFLRGQKCRLVQGFFFSRPLPLADFEEKYLPGKA